MKCLCQRTLKKKIALLVDTKVFDIAGSLEDTKHIKIFISFSRGETTIVKCHFCPWLVFDTGCKGAGGGGPNEEGLQGRKNRKGGKKKKEPAAKTTFHSCCLSSCERNYYCNALGVFQQICLKLESALAKRLFSGIHWQNNFTFSVL